jgi:hypothetical protein
MGTWKYPSVRFSKHGNASESKKPVKGISQSVRSLRERIWSWIQGASPGTSLDLILPSSHNSRPRHRYRTSRAVIVVMLRRLFNLVSCCQGKKSGVKIREGMSTYIT